MKYLIILLLVMLFNPSCKKTCGEPAPNAFLFRVLDKTNFSNSIFCSTSKYNNKDIRITVENNNKLDTILKYTYSDFATMNIDCDSLINVFLGASYSNIYMHLTNSIVDTISLTYLKTGLNSCGYYDNVSSIKFNNKLIQADSNNIYNFYK